MTPPRPLRPRLEEYDGTHTGVLEAIAADALSPESVPPEGVPPEVWDEVVELAVAGDARIAAGATWLFRRWTDGGHRPTGSALARLSAGLQGISDKWSRLHLVQAIPSLPLPDELLPAWIDFSRRGAQAGTPFLRAWSVNALVHLASIDPALHAEADRALQAALSDPKASVRARARKILEGR